MKSLSDGYRLNNGVDIPCVGLGTFRAEEGDIARTMVRSALEKGYRHIDTAAGYGNESSVGKAVRESGVPRGEVFVTSKLHNNEHGYENTLAAFDKTLNNLEMDYLDLYLIHWPNPLKFRDCWQEKNAGSWKAMEELAKAGKIRAIGVSNFLQHHLDALYLTAEIAPAVNQIRLCPGDVREDVVDYCKAKGILLEAYSPLGVGKVFSVPELKEIAEKYGRSVAQISIRWSLQRGFLPLPKSVTAERLSENTGVFDFALADEDMKVINELKDCCGHATNPDQAPH